MIGRKVSGAAAIATALIIGAVSSAPVVVSAVGPVVHISADGTARYVSADGTARIISGDLTYSGDYGPPFAIPARYLAEMDVCGPTAVGGPIGLTILSSGPIDTRYGTAVAVVAADGTCLVDVATLTGPAR